MKKNIPLSIPQFNEREYHYVTEAIKDNLVSTSDSYITNFEVGLSDYLNVEELVACQSGTAAIHLALILAGVKWDDEVIVPALSFIATVNPVRYLGASPIFMDCDDTLNMDIDKLEDFCDNHCYLTEEGLRNKITNKFIRAIVIVHVYGNMMRMKRVMELASRYKLKIIEDATEALGSYVEEGTYKGKYAGTIGDFSAFSFNGNKIITTGGGGMLWCKNSNMAERGRYLSTQANDDKKNYIYNEVGYNYRMTNIQAAIGLGQLEKIEEFIKTKKANYTQYQEGINNIDGLRLLDFNKDMRNNYWFYPLYVDEEVYGITNMELINKLAEKNIEASPIWGIISDQKPYREFQQHFIRKCRYYRTKIINIPCSISLSKIDILTVIEELKKNQK